MTEEWLVCPEPEAMLRSLPTHTTTERKWRLFSVGCCLKLLFWTPNEIVWRLPERNYRADDDGALAALFVAERFADSEATAAEREAAEEALSCICYENQGDKVYDACFETVCNFAQVATASFCAMSAGYAVVKPPDLYLPDDDDDEQYRQSMQRLETAQRWQAELVRCVFGNPFRPVTFAPAWRTSTVVSLAQGIYDDRAFDRMSILADALQDAGCDNDAVLSHCRADTVHTRGCWVVDSVLGKT